MEILTDSSGNEVWIVFTWTTPANVSVGLGRNDEPYTEQAFPSPTAYFWVPLPYSTPRAHTSANWTDWIEWDFKAKQLWWGKKISINASGGKGDSADNPLTYVFYYEER